MQNKIDEELNIAAKERSKGNFDLAEKSYRNVIAIEPNHINAQNNLGNLLKQQGRFDEAIVCYQQALEADPNFALAHFNLATAFLDKGEIMGAITHYKKALQNQPNLVEAAEALLHQLQQVCAWGDFKALKERVDANMEKVIARGRIFSPMVFYHLARSTDLAKNLQVAKAASDKISQQVSVLNMSFEHKKEKKNKITVGYISSDFCNHPVSILINGLFASHDRKKFKVITYSHGKNDESGYREKIAQDSDEFFDVRNLQNHHLAQKIYDDGVDILVDLNSYTKGNRMPALALRPAPIQINYIGFVGTSGASFFDYIIGDNIVIPKEDRDYYSEKCILMPDCYQINDDKQKLPGEPPTREEFHLPQEEFIFCCFNKSYKITEEIFDSWMNILNRVPNSILWLYNSTNPLAEENLRRAAVVKGIRPDRVIFTEKVTRDEHFKRLMLADLALDTDIYNGGATTSDVLYAGTPIISLNGQNFASRMGASMLENIGLKELVVNNLEEYENLAVKLAENPKDLAKIKDKLAKNIKTKPLFDTKKFVKNLEKAYIKAFDNYLDGNNPKDIEVTN